MVSIAVLDDGIFIDCRKVMIKLVSSLTNEQIVSYPAVFPGVFAAFMDNSGFLKDSALGVFHSHGVKFQI